MISRKLSKGDLVTFITPSSYRKIDENKIDIVKTNLSKLELQMNPLRRYEQEDQTPLPIQTRLDELHSAFNDSNVKGILTTNGGHYALNLIDQIRFDIIKANPKVFCGFSNSTILSNVIYKETDLVTYIGPNLTHFGESDQQYTFDSFNKTVFEDDVVNIIEINNNHNLKPLDQILVINNGNMEGKVLGGNLQSFQLLQGTKYLPSFENAIIFIEDIGNTSIGMLDSALNSLSLQKDFKRINGLVLGEFQCIKRICQVENFKECYRNAILQMINSNKFIKNLPVIANVRFGHLIPTLTLPIGGYCKINSSNNVVSEFLFTEH